MIHFQVTCKESLTEKVVFSWHSSSGLPLNISRLMTPVSSLGEGGARDGAQMIQCLFSLHKAHTYNPCIWKVRGKIIKSSGFGALWQATLSAEPSGKVRSCIVFVFF